MLCVGVYSFKYWILARDSFTNQDISQTKKNVSTLPWIRLFILVD